MTILVPMREEQFPVFREEAITTYAHDNVAAGRWPDLTDSLSRASSEFQRLLPKGMSTPDHFLYEIWDGIDVSVGFLWFAIGRIGDARSGHLYTVQIKPELRGRGHAATALVLIERTAVEMGLTSIALHVFAFNAPAQALYRSLGYGITGFNMRKPLLHNDA